MKLFFEMFICLIIGVLIFCFGNDMRKCGIAGDAGCYAACGKYSPKRLIEKYFGIFMMVIGLVLMIVGPCTISYINDAKQQDKIEKAVENGYKVYINGEEVPANTIDIEKYADVTIDIENQFIIITVD